MKHAIETSAPRAENKPFTIYQPLIIGLALAAIVSTFLLATSSLELDVKTRGFSAIIAAFLVSSVGLYLWQTRKRIALRGTVTGSEVEKELFVLDEAREFFAGSLKASDTFRLISSRVQGLVPFRSIALLVLDESRSQLRIAEVEGDAAGRKDSVVAIGEGLAGKCFSSRRVETEPGNGEKHPSVAIPLFREMEVFGVLHLSFEPDLNIEGIDRLLLEAIGTRIAPLVVSSMAFERSHANALTDATTDLPNERAFHLILENQVAESQRKGSSRPLTILAIDIKNFEEINLFYGHAAGDRVLSFAGQVLKDNLRQMDFFARSEGDEFLAVLPTASKEISHEVIARIHTGFFGRKVKVTEDDSIEIELNFGWAAFGEDGETPDTLIKVARLRKDQSKTAAPPKVAWMPQESVN